MECQDRDQLIENMVSTVMSIYNCSYKKAFDAIQCIVKPPSVEELQEINKTLFGVSKLN